jgi:hypothetical protein
MKRRREAAAEPEPHPFPFAALFPELQAEVVRHLPTRTLIEGLASASWPCQELARHELRQRVKFRYPTLSADVTWPALVIYSLRMRVIWVATVLLLATKCMGQLLLENTSNPLTLRVFSPRRHPLDKENVPVEPYWSMTIGAGGRVLVLPSPDVFDSFPSVCSAIRAVNNAFSERRPADTYDTVLECLCTTIAHLLETSYIEFDMDITLHTDGAFFMSHATQCVFMRAAAYRQLLDSPQ